MVIPGYKICQKDSEGLTVDDDTLYVKLDDMQ